MYPIHCAVMVFIDFQVKYGTYVHKAMYSVQNRPREGELGIKSQGVTP